MSYDITHGVGGLWEVHRWTSANGLVFDLNVEVEDADGDPRVELSGVPGLHKLPEAAQETRKRSGRHGTITRRRSAGGKPVTYKGQLKARSIGDMLTARTALGAAFADLRPGTMDIIRHPEIGGPTAQFTAIVNDLEVPEELPDGTWTRDVTIALWQDDPLYYVPSLAVEETGTDSVEVENIGTAPASPVVTVEFDTEGQITIEDGFHTLRTVTVDPVASSGAVIFDFARRKITDANDYEIRLDKTAATWWDPFVDGIQPAGSIGFPGPTITVTQIGGTGITVEYTPAVWF